MHSTDARAAEGMRAARAFGLALLVIAQALPSSAAALQITATPEQSLRRARGVAAAITRAADARDSLKATTRYDETFRKHTKRQFGPGFDWTLFKAQAMAESDLNPNARSRVGARGLMQLMPSTFKIIRSRRPEFGEINDPETNIAAGIMHDRYLYRLWERDIGEAQRMRFVFGSYNAGEGTIARATATARARALNGGEWSSIETVAPTVPRWRYRETLGYVRRIGENHEKLSATPARKR
ncbi:MAG: transglycosylase SLT domain-containing protein [Gemmatimonadota bacterium]